MKTLIDACTKIFNTNGLFLLHDKKGEEIEVIKKWVEVNGEKVQKEEVWNGCTYNFNRTTDKLCFKNSLARFVRTGSREDAFDVFFCYSEIFKTFGGYKTGIDSLLDLLYQHESNSATLLMNHRDHYSHSVYVFALGLAIFTHNKKLQKAFADKYGSENLNENFLKYWGMAGLFHDLGYPYEIAFQQVLEYSNKIDKDDESRRLMMGYTNLNDFVSLSDEEVEKCGTFMPKGKKDINALFASEIYKNFGPLTYNPEQNSKMLEDFIAERITKPSKYMDHGYFSAVLLLKKLLKIEGFRLDSNTLDAIMAIFLHNSFYKYSYKELMADKYEPIHLKSQPLAYLLMLCDELQCWDRAPYGEASKLQELAWDMDIEFNNGKITLNYYFEIGKDKDTEKIKNLISNIKAKVVDTNELAVMQANPTVKKKDKKVYDYFSDSKFINLCKIAEAINVSYMEDCQYANIKEYMQQEFDYLTLEYKLSNVAQAKNYVRHLEDINCFFSDRRLDYTPVEEFTEDEIEFLAVNEHIRWVNEKVSMGWKYGTDYSNRNEREQKRIHKDIVPYNDLNSDAKKKDYNPVNNMIKHLAKYGVKVYRMNNKNPAYYLGCVGHRDLSRIENFNEEKVRGEIRTYIRELQEKYTLTLFCGFADGADLLFAEEAIKCNVSVIAVIPCEWKEFMKEHKDGGVKFVQLLSQTKEVRVKPNHVNLYTEVSRYVVRQCNEMLVLWDGEKVPFVDENGNEINRGGTYDALTLAQKAGKHIRCF